MARQKSILKLEGSIGDVSFYKSEGEYLARTKGGVDGDRIKTDPAFARTRENGAEFGVAGKASKLLRTAFKAPVAALADNRVASRLTTQMLKVVQSDTVHSRGERTVQDGNLSLIQGFEFNVNTGLEDVVKAAYSVAFDRVSGEASVTIDFSNPSLELNQVEGADQAQILIGVAAVDFENNEYEVDVLEADAVSMASTEAILVQQTASVSANSTRPVFVIVGVMYYQSVNDELYLINSQDSRALALVAVDQPE
jgi:hypothetical protein